MKYFELPRLRWHLLMTTFAHSLDLNQARLNVVPDLDSKLFLTTKVLLKELTDQKNLQNYPACKHVSKYMG